MVMINLYSILGYIYPIVNGTDLFFFCLTEKNKSVGDA